ncbi:MULTISPECIES: GDSL-type esterase/lipase family protein [unclassified Spirosoma]|uniref:GDSL-type esterase/lipase family protein n=1 Tax=unclassified Spirosoma TaxID=2621999 RepID=UPI00095F4FA2|nr:MULTISPECIES: GDSL-type esterase/lipase family protein [unclassified Spirosoma]MBN8826443.1 GDSL family lipase [Spirosoma sp.]OJW75832.1 MAG: GDSL family lipase [Spirosoma sp. 48-14]
MVWYEAEVRQLETKLMTLPPASDRVVFYGSSSIRLWTTLAQDFPQINSLNLGFGGSTLAACSWFFERLLLPAAPKAVLFYAGDNDLGDGRHPEEVYLFFCTFADKMQQHFPDLPLFFLSIKISPARWGIVDRIRYTNYLIGKEVEKRRNAHYIDMTAPLLWPNGQPRRESFENDGLHLSPAGYQAWKRTLEQQIPSF